MPVSLQHPSLLGASAHTARIPHPRRTSPACGAPRPRRQASREPPRSAVDRPRSPRPDSVILDRISAPSRDPELARSFPLLERQDKRPPGRELLLEAFCVKQRRDARMKPPTGPAQYSERACLLVQLAQYSERACLLVQLRCDVTFKKNNLPAVQSYQDSTSRPSCCVEDELTSRHNNHWC
ncbi:hypothetical protein ACQJBY_009418 [Aegilops geniculata]